MVLLRCQSFWERLIPTFVFFFQNSTPFAGLMTDQPNSSSRGCILIRYEALTRVGGIQVVHALIDDCTLLKLSSLVVNQSSQGQGSHLAGTC